MERNISLELELRLMEDKIASDQLISSLTVLENSNSIILGRIVETYMYNLSQDNDIIVELFPENEKDKDAIAYFTAMVSGGTPIADESRFRYRRDAGGNSLLPSTSHGQLICAHVRYQRSHAIQAKARNR